MSRKADCYDNAPMESFFHTLKTELVHHRQYKTRQEAKRDIFAYIEGFYNRTRRHSAIGYISPIERELKAAQPCPFFRGKITVLLTKFSSIALTRYSRLRVAGRRRVILSSINPRRSEVVPVSGTVWRQG